MLGAGHGVVVGGGGGVDGGVFLFLSVALFCGFVETVVFFRVDTSRCKSVWCICRAPVRGSVDFTRRNGKGERNRKRERREDERERDGFGSVSLWDSPLEFFVLQMSSFVGFVAGGDDRDVDVRSDALFFFRSLSC